MATFINTDTTVFERSAIQDLSKYSLISLNQNSTYALQKREAAQCWLSTITRYRCQW
jgi:hypothetical protein